MVGIVAGLIYTLTQTPRFLAESRLMLRSPYTPYSDSRGGELSLGVDSLAQTYDIDTEVERIRNPELVKEARQRLSPRLRNSAITALLVRQVGKTEIISISVASPNPQFAAQMSREMAAAYIEHTRRMRQIATEQALKYVAEQAANAKADLDKAYSEPSGAQQTNGIADLGSGEGRVAGPLRSRYQQLMSERLAAETAYSELLSQAQVLRIRQASAVASAFVLARPEIPTTPVSPRLGRNLLNGAVVGLFLGLIAGLIACPPRRVRLRPRYVIVLEPRYSRHARLRRRRHPQARHR